MPFCRVANVGDLHRSETHFGRRLAEQIGAGPNDRAMVVFYDSIRRPPAPGIPPVLNSSVPFIGSVVENLNVGMLVTVDLKIGSTATPDDTSVFLNYLRNEISPDKIDNIQGDSGLFGRGLNQTFHWVASRH